MLTVERFLSGSPCQNEPAAVQAIPGLQGGGGARGRETEDAGRSDPEGYVFAAPRKLF